jgi:hypothetical protein
LVHVGGVDYDDDRRELEALCAAVPTELSASIANKATTKLAWDAIAAARVGGDRVRRATLQRLRGEWEALAFQPGEQIKDFAVRLTNLMEQMAHNGDTNLTEERTVEKFLRYMPKRYAQIVNSIETLLDFEQLTVEDITGWFKKESTGPSKDRRRRPRGGKKNKPKGDHDGGGGQGRRR